MPVPGKYRSGCSQSSIRWNTAPPPPNGDAREITQGAKGVCNPIGGIKPGPPKLVFLAAYVAEDGLVGHHWEERPLGLANFICPSTGKCQGQEGEWVGRGPGQGGGYRELSG
jgi:hypothetical protein